MDDRIWNILEQFPVAALVLVVVYMFMRYIRDRDDKFTDSLDGNTEALHEVAEALTALKERGNNNNREAT